MNDFYLVIDYIWMSNAKYKLFNNKKDALDYVDKVKQKEENGEWVAMNYEVTVSHFSNGAAEHGIKCIEIAIEEN